MTRLATQELIIDVPGRRSGTALNLTIEPGRYGACWAPTARARLRCCIPWPGFTPRSGQVLLGDTPLGQLRRRQVAQRLGLVFQERLDGFPATVLETALIGRHPYLSLWQREGADDYARAEAALAALDVAHLRDRPGEHALRRRTPAGSRGHGTDQAPSLWLADEPTNHLDLHHQSAVMALMAEQAAQGSAVMMCLHDLNLAARWCDHILLLYPSGEACWGPGTPCWCPAPWSGSTASGWPR